jgi:hypothetical protein
MEGNLTYFRRRASQERTATLKAGHPHARQAHLDMANRYEDLIRAIAATERQLDLHAIENGLRFLRIST